MKYLFKFNEINSEEKFKYKKIGDICRISLNELGDTCYIDVIEMENAYENDFKDYMSYDKYLDIFKKDTIYCIEMLNVTAKSRGKGYAKSLIKESIDYAKKLGYEVIYLNASPVGHSIDLDSLVKLYNRFGFEVIEELDKWDDNKEMILKL